jgi:hypothetical protein
MRFWPFGRKSSRKRKQSGAGPLPETIMHAQQDPGKPEANPPGLGRKKSGTGKDNRRSGREPKKLQRDPERRTYSFSPGRNDTIRVPKDIHRTHPVPPIPQNMSNAPEGQKSSQDWQRVPTLHKRSGQDLPRRKSSKKRKEEHDREAEIKAMSVTMPLPPTRAATDMGLASRLVHKQSRKMRTSIGRNFTNPTSNTSLPAAESLHSPPSSDAENYGSYKLKGFEVFAPRPTIRYAQNPRIPNSGAAGSQEFGSRRLPDREEITQSILNANKRIDDLADDLDASALRELMERDQRRKERKKVADQKKAERKIARNTERQRQAEAEAVRNGTPPPRNMDRGVLGREVVGLGIEGETSSIKGDASNASSKRRGKRPATVEQEEPTAVVQHPFGDFQRTDSLPPTEPGSPVDEGEDLEIGTAQVARLSRVSMSQPSSPLGHARDASNISEMMDLTKMSTAAERPTETPIEKPADRPLEKPEANRSSSESGARQHRSWTAFFGRSNKPKRNSTPTSFSNTSRESASTSHPAPTTFTPRGSTSTVPKRTKSRFREDLPESPMSPPDSRVQSPEADAVPPIHTGFPEKKTGVRGSTENPMTDTSIGRHDTPTSGYRSLEQAPRNRNETPTSDHRSDIPSPEPSAVMSQSLASIDSEGSWLSGRPRGSLKRGSAQHAAPPLRDSASSLQKRYKEFSDSAEELGIAEDEYFSRLTPGPDDDFGTRSKRRASGNPMPSSDEEDGESVASPGGSTKWGAVGRQPTVVHHDTRSKSREVLLADFENDSLSERQGETPRDLVDRKSYGFDKPLPDDPAISRASSVNLSKGHVRHISAGSARLLNLKPRPSGEAKRLSTGQPTESGA